MVGMVVTRGFDRNLMIYPLGGWQQLAQKIMSQPLSDTRMRAFRRRVFSRATDLTPDRQGRILLPAQLREFAGIEGEVVVVGNYDYLEIWAVEAWDAQRAKVENLDDELSWEDLGI